MEHVLLTGLLLSGCRPDPGPSLALIQAPRLLALRGTPAEIAPGGTLLWEALVAGSDGDEAPPLAWSLCRAPRPLTTNDVVAPECLSASGVEALATAPSVSATVPGDACQRFGPELPPSLPDKPDPRPVAADASGGWYQPYRADLGGTRNIGLQRIRCHLAGASSDVAAQFQMQYRANVNPSPGPILVDGAPSDEIRPGAKVQLTVSWSADTPESYPVFDVSSQTLVPHRESMRVSWFVTGGTLSDERTGREGDDPALETGNLFTAPDIGPVHVWAVLRDDRGGAGWSHTVLQVR